MNYKLTALLIAVLIMVGGAVLLTRALNTRTLPEQATEIYRVNADDLDGIRVTYEGSTVEYQLLTDPDEITSVLGDVAPSEVQENYLWVIEDDQRTPVYLPTWGNTPSLLSGPEASRQVEVLDPQTTDLSRYGLDPPRTSVGLNILGREVIRFHMGDPTPDEETWYIRRVGDNRLFTVSAGWGDAISKLVTEPPYAPSLFDVEVEDITLISATSIPRLQRFDYELRDSGWTIVEYEPEGREWIAVGDGTPVDEEAWAEILSLLSDRRVSESQERDIDDAEIYGLHIDQARVSVLMRHTDEEETTFFLGNETPEGGNWFAGAADQETLYIVPTEWGEAMVRLVTDPPFPR